MSRTIDAHGDTLEGALRASLAQLLECEIDKVEVELRAPGLDAVAGDVALRLTIGAPTEPGEPASQADDDELVEVADEDVEAAGEDEDVEAVDEDVEAADEDEAEAEQEEEAAEAEFEITVEDLDAEADAAADFLEGLLDALDLPGDLRIKVHEDHAEVELVDIGSGALIGRRGQTLEAIQELVRCALQRQFQRRSHVKIDAEGYRARRLEKLLEKAEATIDEVLDTGEAQRLEPMDVFERKAVHHLVAEHDGVLSRSQGREPARRVIIELED